MLSLTVPAAVDGGTMECYVSPAAVGVPPPAGSPVPAPTLPVAPALLFLTDIFGFGFVNSQLLADTYAAAGVHVYVPNIFGRAADGSADAVPAATLNVNDEAPAPSFLGRTWQGVRFAAAIPSLVPWLMRHGEAVTAVRVAAAAAAVRALLPPGTPLIAAGYCFGGCYALRLGGGAAPVADAVVAVHPSGIALPRDAEALVRPTLFCLAEADFAFSNGAVTAFKAAIEKRGGEAPSCTWKVYSGPGVKHGFAVRGGHHTDAARAQCAKDVAEFCHAVTAKG